MERRKHAKDLSRLAMAPDVPTTGQRASLLLYAAIAIVLALHAQVLIGSAGATAPGVDADRGIVLVAALALAIGAVMAWRQATPPAAAFSIGALCGLMFFTAVLGTALVDPAAIGWLLRDDLAQHYSGWAMFRATPWHWPPGAMPELWYPVGTSIAYTDSLPLLALLLKPLSPWLPEPFQYIGAWMMANFILQGGFGALLTSRATRQAPAILAGAALFVSAPVLLNRFGHDTLTTQWLLLAALWLYFRDTPASGLVREAWPWWLLCGVAILVHPYLAAMVLAIQLAWSFRRVRVDRERTPRETALALAASGLVLLVLFWASGAMSIHSTDSSGGVPYGRYSFNLLGFFNPMGWSRLLPTLPSGPGQYEGFAFPGIGVLALAAWLLVDAVLRRRLPTSDPRWKPLAVLALAMCLFAASSVPMIGNVVLFDWPMNNRLLGAFRSSGRFVWVAYYALIVWVVWGVCRHHRPNLAGLLLAIALVAQLADLDPIHRYQATTRRHAREVPAQAQLADPGWARLAQGRRHLTMLPPRGCGAMAGPYLPFQLFAAAHRLTFNSGYIARWNARATEHYCEQLDAQAESGQWSREDIYVVNRDNGWKERFERNAPPHVCEPLDGYDVCVLDGEGAGNQP